MTNPTPSPHEPSFDAPGSPPARYIQVPVNLLAWIEVDLVTGKPRHGWIDIQGSNDDLTFIDDAAPYVAGHEIGQPGREFRSDATEQEMLKARAIIEEAMETGPIPIGEVVMDPSQMRYHRDRLPQPDYDLPETDRPTLS